MSSGVRKQSISKCHGDGAPNRQTVEPVGKIDRIRGTNNDEEKKYEGKPAHVRNDRGLDEWHIERTRLHFQQRTGEENDGDNYGKSNLKNQFDPAADAIGLLLRHLEIIISESESTEINHAHQDQPNEAVIEARPHETGHKDGPYNQHATHGRRSLLAAMEFSKTMNFRRSADRLS